MARILAIDDDPALLQALTHLLTGLGYEVLTASDGQSGLTIAQKEEPDLIVLDVSMPGMDGVQVCRAVRARSLTPILILSARDEEIDKVLGLEMGADDYLTKPFSPRELAARVRALLRRSEMLRHAAVEGGLSLKQAALVVDLVSRRASLGGKPLRLTPKEFDLLAFLMRHRGRAFSRRELQEQVWGYEAGVDTRTVDVHVRWLREKLRADPSAGGLIETVRGFGYRFVE